MSARVRDLGVAARLAAFAVGLVVVGCVAALAGAATGHGRVTTVDNHGGDAMAMEQVTPGEQTRASGSASVAGGYTFVPAQATLPLGKTSIFRFRILDERGDTVRDIDVDGGVRVHLIVVRRDFVGYQHVHPKLQEDGSWTVPLALAAPGAYQR